MVHVKKCWPEPFAAMKLGVKPFEWRREDDCTYKAGDVLLLLEYAPSVQTGTEPFYEKGYYTGEHRPVMSEAGYTGDLLKRKVTYVLRGEFGVPEGYVVMGLAPIQKE